MAADPVSLAASIAGLIFTTVKTAYTVNDIISKYKDVPQTVSAIATSLRSIEVGLLIFEQRFRQDSKLLTEVPSLLDHIDDSIVSCTTFVSKLEFELRKILDVNRQKRWLARNWDTIGLIWSHADIERSRAWLERVQSDLSFLFQIVSMVDTQTSFARVKQQLNSRAGSFDKTRTIAQSIREIDPEVQSIMAVSYRGKNFDRDGASTINGTIDYNEVLAGSAVYQRRFPPASLANDQYGQDQTNALSTLLEGFSVLDERDSLETTKIEQNWPPAALIHARAMMAIKTESKASCDFERLWGEPGQPSRYQYRELRYSCFWQEQYPLDASVQDLAIHETWWNFYLLLGATQRQSEPLGQIWSTLNADSSTSALSGLVTRYNALKQNIKDDVLKPLQSRFQEDGASSFGVLQSVCTWADKPQTRKLFCGYLEGLVDGILLLLQLTTTNQAKAGDIILPSREAQSRTKEMLRIILDGPTDFTTQLQAQSPHPIAWIRNWKNVLRKLLEKLENAPTSTVDQEYLRSITKAVTSVDSLWIDILQFGQLVTSHMWSTGGFHLLLWTYANMSLDQFRDILAKIILGSSYSSRNLQDILRSVAPGRGLWKSKLTRWHTSSEVPVDGFPTFSILREWEEEELV